jgi:hypothetical protein
LATHFVELSDDDFVKEALEIVEKADSRGLYLRILGSLAAYVHALNNGCGGLFKSLERYGEGMPLFTDLDLAAYGKQKGAIDKFLRELSFQPDALVNSLFGHRRLVYYHPQRKYHIDVFLNKLEFSHDVTFGEKPGSGRLEIDYPTISPTDIILEKLQIHEINRKDLIDLISLFIVHEVHEQPGKNGIDGDYITKLLSNEWGFWYDATTNLGRVKSLLEKLTDGDKLSAMQSQIARQRIDRLLSMITNSPKTRRWEKRARTGTSKPWYREVEEVVR